VCGRLPHPREKRGTDTGPSPVDRRKTGSKHHLICDGRGTPLKVITAAANVNDVTQTLALVDGIPPIAGRPGRPRRRPEALLGDKGYDSNPNREELRKRRILPVISRKGAPNIQGLGTLRYVVEQTFALLHQFKRLAVRWERRTELPRCHTPAATEYAAAKRRCAAKFRDDRPGYLRAKDAFARDIIRRADDWAQRTGWIPDPTDA
jgi:IS5 family transposase